MPRIRLKRLICAGGAAQIVAFALIVSGLTAVTIDEGSYRVTYSGPEQRGCCSCCRETWYRRYETWREQGQTYGRWSWITRYAYEAAYSQAKLER